MTQVHVSKQQFWNVVGIIESVLDTIKASDWHGAPAGSICNALMCHGCSFEAYTQVMALLVDSGLVTKRGQCYFPTAKAMRKS